MYKILIAEDEWITKNSLMEAVDWAKVGCEVVASAKDGYEALELIEQFLPDIVISDIKMDGMDGLELCMNINKLFSGIKVIFITGYSEFDYAQNAIKLGVKDFLLKPTDPDKILEAVARVVKEIENNEVIQQKFVEMQKIVSENIPILREKFLLELVSGKRFSTAEINKKQKFLNIDSQDFYIIAGEIDSYDELMNEYEEEQRQVMKLMIRDICEVALNQYGFGYHIEKDTNLFFMFVKCINAMDLTEYIQERIAAVVGVSLSFGISKEASGLENMSSCYEQSVQALRQNFYLGNNCIVEYSDLKIEDKQVISANYTGTMITSIMEYVRAGNCEGAIEKLGALVIEIKELRHKNHFYIRNIAFELIVLLQRFLSDINEDPQKVIQGLYYEEITYCKTINDVKNHLSSIIMKVTSLIEAKNKKMSETVINKIIDYLQHNYFKDITLDELGKIVFMNPKYVCRLIKKETGSNFSDILLGIRIDNAKKLMRETELKTFEIAEKVGIKDSRYFSKVFKKMTGVTPTEYKQQFPCK